MYIQHKIHLNNHSQITINELTQAPIIIHNPNSQSTYHKQFKVEQTKYILQIYHNQTNLQHILTHKLNPIPSSPILYLIKTFLIKNTPN